MRRLNLSSIIDFSLRRGAVIIDEESMRELDSAIDALIDLKVQAEKLKREAGGILPEGGLLVIGSDTYSAGEPPLNSVVHCLESFRAVRRKSK